MEHQDEHITCAECGTTFVLTKAEAESFASKKLDLPKRCFECRKARRAQRNAGHRDAPPRGHHAGDVNGYRSPMPDPGWSARGGRDGEYRAPGFRDSRDRSTAGRGNSGEYRSPGFRDDRGARGNSGEYRAPGFRDDRGPRSGEYRAPAFRDDRGGHQGEYRAPGFQGDGANRGGGHHHGPPGSGRRDRGPGDRHGDNRGPRPPRDQGAPGGHARGPRNERAGGPPGERAPRGERPQGKRPHGERPSFPITCAQCGAASEVPFKPLEGRELLCRDCYRGRKESAA